MYCHSTTVLFKLNCPRAPLCRFYQCCPWSLMDAKPSGNCQHISMTGITANRCAKSCAVLHYACCEGLPPRNEYQWQPSYQRWTWQMRCHACAKAITCHFLKRSTLQLMLLLAVTFCPASLPEEASAQNLKRSRILV